MGVFNNLEEAKTYFSGDRFATDNGMTLDELSDERVVCSMEITERHRNAHGGVMGGAIFTLADLAFAVATNHNHRPTVAQQVSVNFLRAPKEGVLRAIARCKKDGKTTCVYNVDVVDDEGRDVAQFTGVGYKL